MTNEIYFDGHGGLSEPYHRYVLCLVLRGYLAGRVRSISMARSIKVTLSLCSLSGLSWISRWTNEIHFDGPVYQSNTIVMFFVWSFVDTWLWKPLPRLRALIYEAITSKCDLQIRN